MRLLFLHRNEKSAQPIGLPSVLLFCHEIFNQIDLFNIIVMKTESSVV